MPESDNLRRLEASVVQSWGLQGSPGWEAWEHSTTSARLALRPQLVRSISGDRETVIEHLQAEDAIGCQALLERAVESARQHGSQFLTLQLKPEQVELKERLERLGFVHESERIVMPSAEHPVPAGSPYSVRDLQSGDDFLIAVRNAQLLEHTLTAGREYNLSDLTFHSMEAMFEQLRRPAEEQQTLVLIWQGQQVGHLILELQPTSGYISDVGVEPQHWGGKATSILMRAGSTWLHRRGLERMVGDVSASNQRALKFAKRFLGFSLESLRYGLKL